MSNSESEQYDLLDRLAEEFAERFRRGERPALSEYTNRYPELANDIRELFPAMVKVEHVELARQRDEMGDSRAASPTASAGRRLPDPAQHRPRRHGRGVRGRADLAGPAQRRVKVLPRHVSSDRTVLERFRREARAAAKLHHTNIVPVYEVGQDGDVRFYAMQFIHGQGLDQVITELRRLRDRSGSESTIKGASRGQSRGPRRRSPQGGHRRVGTHRRNHIQPGHAVDSWRPIRPSWTGPGSGGRLAIDAGARAPPWALKRRAGSSPKNARPNPTRHWPRPRPIVRKQEGTPEAIAAD